jgi:hypothetical protein
MQSKSNGVVGQEITFDFQGEDKQGVIKEITDMGDYIVSTNDGRTVLAEERDVIQLGEMQKIASMPAPKKRFGLFASGGDLDGEPRELKGYSVRIFSSDLGSKSNILNEKNRAILVTDGKKGDSSTVFSNEPYLKLVKRDIFGNTVLSAEPVNYGNEGKHKMFGGTFVWSSDSRFREDISSQPIALHDRVEYAKGGMTEHGLEIGDEILGYTKDVNELHVKNSNNAEWHSVDLDDGKRYGNGGLMKYEFGGELDEKFTIEEIKTYLNNAFPDSFEFSLSRFSEEGNIFKNQAALIVNPNESYYGLSDKEISSSLFFPKYPNNPGIRFRIYQGGENTYFYFILESQNQDIYIGQFGFKDRGNVPSNYITKFLAFLMKQYGLPFEVNHEVMSKGGSTNMKYKIFEGYDHFNNKPLYKVTDNEDYEGEWHSSRADAKEELDELINSEKMSTGGGVGKIKVKGFPPISKQEAILLNEDFEENFNSNVERFTKHLNKVHNSRLRTIDVKEVIDFAKKSNKNNFATGGNVDQKGDYMLLGRLQSDCDYFLGFGNRNEGRLWAGNVKDQITEMKSIYNRLKVKPEWITMKDINRYEKQMTSKMATGGGVDNVDLFFGGLGNGTSVFDRNRLEKNQYKNIAHISDQGKISYIDKNLPESVKKEIEEWTKKYKPKFDKGGEVGKTALYQTNQNEKLTKQIIDTSFEFFKSNGVNYGQVADLGTEITIEPSTVIPAKSTLKKGSLDGMQIIYDVKSKVYEVSEYMAGPNEDELYIFGEYKSLIPALKSLIKGNSNLGRKPIKKYARGGKLTPAQQLKFGKVMHEFKEGELHSGSKTGPIVKKRDQAIAIALSEANASKKMAAGGGVGNQNDKLDNEIFKSLLTIYKSEGNSGKDLFSFSEYKLKKVLSEDAFNRLKSGKSPLGKIQLYGGGVGQYYALNIANGDFYKRLKGNYAEGGGVDKNIESTILTEEENATLKDYIKHPIFKNFKEIDTFSSGGGYNHTMILLSNNHIVTINWESGDVQYSYFTYDNIEQYADEPEDDERGWDNEFYRPEIIEGFPNYSDLDDKSFLDRMMSIKMANGGRVKDLTEERKALLVELIDNDIIDEEHGYYNDVQSAIASNDSEQMREIIDELITSDLVDRDDWNYRTAKRLAKEQKATGGKITEREGEGLWSVMIDYYDPNAKADSMGIKSTYSSKTFKVNATSRDEAYKKATELYNSVSANKNRKIERTNGFLLKPISPKTELKGWKHKK